MKSNLAFLALLASLPAAAASFVTVACYPPVGSSAVTYFETATYTRCSAQSSYNPNFGGGTGAYGEVIFKAAATPSDYNVLTTSQSAGASEGLPVPPSLFGSGGDALVSINYQATISISGPSRAGFIQIQEFGNGLKPYEGFLNMSNGLVIPDADFTSVVSCYYMGCSPGEGYYNYLGGLIPVTLSNSITLVAQGNSHVFAGGGDGISGGSLDTSFAFRFFEADGVTPVSTFVVATPEPSSWAATGLGLLVCGALYFVRKKPLGCSTAHSIR